MREHTFHDIECVVDEVHDLFDAWLQDGTLQRYGLLVMKLAVHEWIANLVQHAAFVTKPPMIRLVVSQRPSGLHCLVQDNSEGFDLDAQVEKQAEMLSDAKPSERGRGLLMMLACAEEFAYETKGDGLQHLEFVVRPPVDEDSMPSFFPANDKSLGQA